MDDFFGIFILIVVLVILLLVLGDPFSKDYELCLPDDEIVEGIGEIVTEVKKSAKSNEKVLKDGTVLYDSIIFLPDNEEWYIIRLYEKYEETKKLSDYNKFSSYVEKRFPILEEVPWSLNCEDSASPVIAIEGSMR